MATKIFLGTEIKLNISIPPLGDVTMDDYDFSLEVYCSQKRVVTISKKDLIRMDSENYVALIDTSELGAGDIKCKVIAYIPDWDFPDKTRTEISVYETDIQVYKNL